MRFLNEVRTVMKQVLETIGSVAGIRVGTEEPAYTAQPLIDKWRSAGTARASRLRQRWRRTRRRPATKAFAAWQATSSAPTTHARRSP